MPLLVGVDLLVTHTASRFFQQYSASEIKEIDAMFWQTMKYTLGTLIIYFGNKEIIARRRFMKKTDQNPAMIDRWTRALYLLIILGVIRQTEFNFAFDNIIEAITGGFSYLVAVNLFILGRTFILTREKTLVMELFSWSTVPLGIIVILMSCKIPSINNNNYECMMLLGLYSFAVLYLYSDKDTSKKRLVYFLGFVAIWICLLFADNVWCFIVGIVGVILIHLYYCISYKHKFVFEDMGLLFVAALGTLVGIAHLIPGTEKFGLMILDSYSILEESLCNNIKLFTTVAPLSSTMRSFTQVAVISIDSRWLESMAVLIAQNDVCIQLADFWGYLLVPFLFWFFIGIYGLMRYGEEGMCEVALTGQQAAEKMKEDKEDGAAEPKSTTVARNVSVHMFASVLMGCCIAMVCLPEAGWYLMGVAGVFGGMLYEEKRKNEMSAMIVDILVKKNSE